VDWRNLLLESEEGVSAGGSLLEKLSLVYRSRGEGCSIEEQDRYGLLQAIGSLWKCQYGQHSVEHAVSICAELAQVHEVAVTVDLESENMEFLGGGVPEVNRGRVTHEHLTLRRSILITNLLQVVLK